MKEKWTKRQWITWSLQCCSYACGITLGIKEIFFKKATIVNEGLKHLERGLERGLAHPPPPPPPTVDWQYLIWIAVALIAITVGLRFMRKE